MRNEYVYQSKTKLTFSDVSLMLPLYQVTIDFTIGYNTGVLPVNIPKNNKHMAKF